MAVESLNSEDPEEVGGYRLIGRLGSGGQGVVYLARRHDRRETQVALKVPHGAFGADSHFDPDHFTAEFALIRRVARFCTARVLDAGVDDGRPYIVSEYVDGLSLQQVVEADGPLRGSELERLAVRTITALAATHAAGVVHRDFKPQNVLLGPGGPRVVDFGVATALPASSGRSGTPQYMAPEQIRDEGGGAPADVFGWAVTMTFAATGSPAFGEDSPPAVFNQILHVEPDLEDLPAWLRDVVASCLSKEAGERPQAHEILLGLLGYDEEALRRSTPPAPVPPQSFHDPRTPTFDHRRPVPSDPEPQRAQRASARSTIASWRRHRGLMVATALALAASLAVVLGVVYWPTEQQNRTPSVAPSTAAGPPQLTVGSANFAESLLISEIYAQALESKGYRVARKPTIGPRETYYSQVASGAIDVIPEYNGALASYVGGQGVEAFEGSTTERVDQRLREKLPDTLLILDSAKAEDKDSITVTRQTAKAYALRSIGDLKAVSKDFVLGGAPEFETRHQGVIGLRAVYEVGFKNFQPFRLDDFSTLAGLLSRGSVQAAQLFTTDPAIKANDLVVLADPKHLFSAQNIVPLAYKPAADDTVRAALNGVSGKLTTEDLLYMNTRIAVNKDKYQAVARAWLTQVGLI